MTKKQVKIEERWATDTWESSTYEPPKKTIAKIDSEAETTKAATPQSLARSLVKARLDEAKRLAETVIKPSEDKRTKHFVGTAHDTHQEVHGSKRTIDSVFEDSGEPISNFSSLMPNPKTDVVAFIDKTFNYSDNISGLRTEVSLLYTSDKNIAIIGKVLNKKNEVVGKFTRYLRSNGVVDHSEFEINADNQNTGFGKRFYENQEKSYLNNGYDFIYLVANGDVGGYAWARMGFDFSTNETKNRMAELFYAHYQERYGNNPSLETADAWEIASYKGPDGHSIGKEFMMGTEWTARKDLAIDSLGYQIGQQYYASK